MDHVGRSVWVVHHEDRTKDTKGSEICDSNCRGLRGEIAFSKGQPQVVAPTDFKNEFSASFALRFDSGWSFDVAQDGERSRTMSFVLKTSSQ